jgi:[acyl-carrier-protein] S-malonyltransferase
VETKIHSDVEGIRAALVQQLVGPVRWTETVRALLASGANAIVECGPGKVLTGLNRRIERNKEIAMLAIEDAASLQEALKLN